MGNLTAERSVEIDAALEECYEIIADLDSTPEWQESMIEIEVLARDEEGRVVLADIKSDAKVKQVTNRMRFTYDPPDGINWFQEKGDMKSLEGEWRLEKLGENRTRATYWLEGDPGRMLGMLLRGPVEGKVKEFLTKDSVEGLKKRAESG